jgi:hypothetical protein
MEQADDLEWVVGSLGDDEVPEDKKPKEQHRRINHHKYYSLKRECKDSVYSQRLGKWIVQGTCMVCGVFGHYAGAEDCPLRRTEPRRRKWAGKVTCTQRATRFATWILSNFDEKTLQQTGVIDIAGGQGMLSFVLQVNHSIPCTVIDPREIIFTENQKKHYQYRTDHPSEFPTGLLQWPQQKSILFKDDFLEEREHEELWNSASLVVGMHPDEAAERIIIFALKYQKNFAVLPCCVFPKSFPHRRTKDGHPVKFYEEFCEYLQNLDPTIEKTTLNIPGRNILLWKRFN